MPGPPNFVEFWKDIGIIAPKLRDLMRSANEDEARMAFRLCRLCASKSDIPLDFCFAMGYRNGSQLAEWSNCVVMHISPNLDYGKVPLVKQAFNACPIGLVRGDTVPGFFVVKYRPHKLKVQQQIDGYCIDDFHFGNMVVIDKTSRRALVSIVIFVKHSIMDRLFSQETLAFVQPDGTSKTRTIYLPKNNIMMQFLMSVIREEDMMEYMAEIEFVDDESAESKTFHEKKESFPLVELEKRFAVVKSNVDKCMYCGITETSTALTQCDVSCTTSYCSEICRAAHLPVHSLMCKKPSTESEPIDV